LGEFDSTGEVCGEERDDVTPETKAVIAAVLGLLDEHCRNWLETPLIADCRKRLIYLLSGDEPGLCEHGIPDGDFCEPCNREYKRAAQEAETE
jgi:hypothetical protein